MAEPSERPRHAGEPWIRHALRDMRQVTSPLSDEQKHERRMRMLMRSTSSDVESIANAVMAKDQNLFMVCTQNGEIPFGYKHAYGLYLHDTRYLNSSELRLCDKSLVQLGKNAGRGFEAAFSLTNPDLKLPDGSILSQQSISVFLTHTLDGDSVRLFDQIQFVNHTGRDLTLPLKLRYSASYDEILSIRGLLRAQFGRLREDALWQDSCLSFTYEGGDKVWRRTRIEFSAQPARVDGGTVVFDLELPAQGEKQLDVRVTVEEWGPNEQKLDRSGDTVDVNKLRDSKHQEYETWIEEQTRLESDDYVLDQLIHRSLHDLRVLRSHVEGRRYVAAGVPWFVNLFGRDSLLAAMQMLMFNPSLAGDTLPLLAELQGRGYNDWLDEQPGKMHHSLRMGEMARCGQSPHIPFFGAVDTTPLFLILLERHAAWTGSLDLFHKLKDAVEGCLSWLDGPGDTDEDGYVDYPSPVRDNSLINQGWKDSGNAILNRDGSVARPPVAMVELQAYTYRAWLAMAELFELAGDGDRASELRGKAGALKQRFNRDFWMEDQGCYAIALQKGGEQVGLVSSNIGHALWGGICNAEYGPSNAERLMQPDMFCGWGVRTLSSDDKNYNPLSYHLGSVWPHDNAIIAAGLRCHRYDQEALRVFDGIESIARLKDDFRLPELVGGFSQHEYDKPVPYPTACHPQAWGAGAATYLLQTLLGVVPDGFNRKLRVVRPILPRRVHELTLRNLKLAQATVDLRFTRGEQAEVQVDVLGVEGELEVVHEPDGEFCP